MKILLIILALKGRCKTYPFLKVILVVIHEFIALDVRLTI